MRRGLALLAVLPLLAGCVASAGPARETPIENVAPLPEDPGVRLRWAPPGDPLRLDPSDCARYAWSLEARAVPPGTNLTLVLQGEGGVGGRLVGSVEPGRVTVSGDDAAEGTVLVCADRDEAPADGALVLMALAGRTAVAFSSVDVVLSGA